MHLKERMVSVTGLGDAVQRQVALHLRGLTVLEFAELALVGGGRKFLHVEETRPTCRCLSRSAAPVLIEAVSMVTSTVPVFASAIEHDFAGRGMQLATPH